jgi:hypothetical protein
MIHYSFLQYLFDYQVIHYNLVELDQIISISSNKINLYCKIIQLFQIRLIYYFQYLFCDFVIIYTMIHQFQ